MRGTSFKNNKAGGIPNGSQFGRQPQPYGQNQQQQQQQRSSSLGRPNNNGNSKGAPRHRQKHSAGGDASSKVSRVSDTASETDVTDTWTAEYDQNSYGSSEGSSDQDSHSDDISEEYSNSRDSAMDDGGSANSTGEWGGPGANAVPFTDEEASYPSVTNKATVANKKKKNIRPPPPPRKKGGDGSMNESSMSIGDYSTRSNGQQGGGDKKLRGSVSSRGNRSQVKKGESSSKSLPGNQSVATSNNHPPQQQHEHEEQSIKLKPPSMKGMPANKFKNSRRSSNASAGGGESSSLAPPSSSSATSEGMKKASSTTNLAAANTDGEGGNTQGAAMQQLAFLVVSLRSDLHDANLARDELETKLEESKHEVKSSGANGGKNPYGDNSKLQQLEKENADLQADVDAFILEQDDLKGDVRQLGEEKSLLNDIIARLKNGSSSACSSGSSVGSSKAKSMAALEERVQDLTDENHKLENEIQLLVGEKSQLRSSSDSRGIEIQKLELSLEQSQLESEEKDGLVGGMQEKMDSLAIRCDDLERECRERKMDMVVLEDELQLKGEELEKAQNSEGNKMTLLRQRLSQVEKQKGEWAERTTALDEVMASMKKKMEELLKERIVAKEEMASLKNDNERLEMERKIHSSQAIAAQATEAETLLSLQKMMSSLEESKGRLEEEIDHKDEQLKFNCVKISQLESTVKMQEEQQETIEELKDLTKEQAEKIDTLKGELQVQEEYEDEEVAGVREENEYLKERIESLTALGEEDVEAREENDLLEERIASLAEANEGMTAKLQELQAQLEQFEDIKQNSAKAVNDLSATLEFKQEGYDTLLSTKSNLESQNQTSMDNIADLQQMIDHLEESKVELEEEMCEATDAIAMLEDELDCKDAQVKELLTKTTMLQQQFSQSDKCKTALAMENAKLSSKNDDLGTEIKVLGIEKKVAAEEIESLKAMATIADEDEEENLFVKNEQKEEIDALLERLEDLRLNSNVKVLALEQQVYQMEESKRKMEENLDESSDAIAMLREALGELEEGKMSRDVQIKELKTSLEYLKNIESDNKRNKEEHQVSVDTIAALQKMIASLETSKDALEEELNESSLALHDLQDQLKFKNTMSEVLQLENKLKRAEDSNTNLVKRVADLTGANEKLKGEIEDLGHSLASASRAAVSEHAASSMALVLSDPDMSSDLISADPVAACDTLISELRNQIKAIVSARDAALEEVEIRRCESSHHSSIATIPPLSIIKINSAAEKVISPLDESTKTEPPSEDDKSVRTKKSIAATSVAPSHAGSRGSSLLEAAKKLCNQLDEKRSLEETEKLSNSNNAAPATVSSITDRRPSMPREVELIKNVVDQDDDNVSKREIKEDSPKETTEKLDAKPEEKKKESSRSKPRLDIDQLTSIYFEKCGMSVSRFSDLSSEASSFRRRTVKAPSDTVTKKVKICRNGVFMGTYEGDLNAEGQRHGFGVLLCDNGNSYEGEWKKDKRDGLGIARYSSGDVYDGQWQRGKREGHGVMYIEAGDTYIGSWNNGLKHGAGTYHWADGEVDVSWYQEDRRVGEGVRWNSSRSTAFQLIRGTKKDELSLDEAYMTAEKLGLNLEKFSSGVP